MLLRNVRLGPDTEPVDLAIADGAIAASSDGPQHDLDGRYVVPGLWDHHVHFTQWAQTSRRIDLRSADSPQAAAALVRDVVAGEHDEVVVGYGFRDALWVDEPGADYLDFTEDPVVLVSADLHCVWINSAAASRFAVRPGVLRETEAMALYAHLTPELSTLDQWRREAVAAAHARGVVGVVDLEAPFSLDDWLRISDARMRVRCGVWPVALGDAIGRGLRTGDVVHDMVSMGPLKVITDGSLNTRTAYCYDVYPGTSSTGMLVVPIDELVEVMNQARAAGIEAAVHAIGDAANALVLDAFARTGSRGSVEHAQLLDLADLERFARLGLTASVQPEHAMDDRDVAERYWPGRTDRAYMLRTLLDSGIRLALGSDAPVAALDPWVAIAAAVTRSRDGREPWHNEQAITVDEALRASVAGPLVVGAPADLVVLDGDPWDVTALRDMPVAATMVAGSVVYGDL